MSRQCSPDLLTNWKLSMPATIAGTIEFMVLDPATGKPKYGARNKLVVALLSKWIAEQRREAVIPTVPTREQLLLGEEV